MTDKKTQMTFGEWTAAVLLGGSAGILIYILFVPLGLFYAWMRVKMWDWFVVPYFQLPHISVWLMYALGLLIYMLKPDNTQQFKDEYYKASETSRIFVPMLVQLFSFLVAWIIHTWILKP
jgi:hypothetical protein